MREGYKELDKAQYLDKEKRLLSINLEPGVSVTEEVFQQIIDNIPGGVFVYSAEADERFAYLNKNMLTMLGYTREEFDQKFGNRFSQMVYTEDRQRVLKQIDHYISQGSYDNCYYRIEKGDGSLLWVHDEGHIITDCQGHKWFYVVIADITPSLHTRELLVNRNEQLRKIIDNVPACIIVYHRVENALSVVTVNKFLCTLAAMSYEDFVRQSFEETISLVHPEDRSVARAFFAKLCQQKLTSAEVVYRAQVLAPGMYQWFRCRAVQVEQPDGSSFIYAIYTDATYEKAVERANELKSEFLSSVSHDMRTPLNAIMGYNSLALKAEKTGEIRNYLLKVGYASKTLLSLINDTLDLQKIESGVIILKPEPVRCQDVVSEILNEVRPLAEEKHINLVVDNSKAVLATINVDSLRVKEIFVNLLANAVKFTPDGGKVEFIIECVGLHENCIHDKIIIRDNGFGMSSDFLAHKIYLPFSQERTQATAHIGGSGLGLSIVKRLVDLMNGKIEVASRPGHGTEFIVYLDLERTEDLPQGLDKPDEEPEDLSGLKLLLCEDNLMNAEIAKKLLEYYGATVVSASDGLEGYNRFLRSQPKTLDAVLMDIRMPVMDGYEAARKIRASKHPDARSIPIIAMTASTYDSDVQAAKEAGMDGHVGKPVDPKTLVRTILHLTQK
jgi:PAS domain S-box-containing protein